MPAVIKTTFPRGFVLRNEHLIKINEIVSKKLTDFGIPQDIIYKISRKDSVTYETKSHTEILDEENSKRNKILELNIYSVGDNFIFNLNFDHEDGTRLAIEANDKDNAYILYSDIKSYLETEVLTIKGFRGISKFFSALLPIVMIIAISYFLLADSDKTHLTKIDSILAGSIDEKLNYLITLSTSKKTLPTVSMYLVFLLSLLLLIFSSWDYINNIVFRKNIFCWGKEEVFYNRYIEIRSKILWALALSIPSALVGKYFIGKL